MKKTFLKLFGFSIITLIAATSCEGTKEVEKITDLEKKSLTAEDTLDKTTRVQGDAHSGQYFSRTDSVHPYGMGTVFYINDSLLEKDIRVCVNFWVRTNVLHTGHSIGISLHDGENITSWSEIYLDKLMLETNKWFNVKDSVTIPGNLINKPGLLIKVFALNSDKKSFLDTDDIEVVFKKTEMVIAE